jgi:HEAT repeat protein
MRCLLVAAVLIGLLGCGRAGPTVVHGKPVSEWVRAARDPDSRVRQKAVDVLANAGPVDPEALAALTAALKDRDARVRARAVLALLKCGPAARDAVPALEAARHDADATVRGYAGKALEKIQARN